MDRFLATGTPFSEFCRGLIDDINMVLTPVNKLGEAMGWVAAKLTGGVKKPIEEMTDEEYADQQGISVEQARKIRKNREAFKGQLRSSGEVSAAQNAQIVNSTVNNSASTATTNNNKSSTVNQTFNFNGTSDEMQDKLVSIVKQGATGVR